MASPDTFRCDLTSDRLDRAEPELAAALALWARRRQAAMQPLRERLEPRLRVLGLVLSACGVLLSGWAVVASPDQACPRAPGGGDAFFQVATPLFAVLLVLFWFLPRLTAELRAWAPGAAARRAPQLLARLRPHLPSEVTYRLEGGRLHATLSRPRRTSATPLGALGGAVVGGSVACLFGRPPLSRPLRVVWLAGQAERATLVAALGGAGVPVVDLPG